MKYSAVRESIKSGDIVAWCHRDFYGKIISLFTKSKFTHVGIAWVIGGRVFVIEAVGTGVRIHPLSRLLPFYICFRTNPAWTPDMEEYALEQVGEEYSKLEAIRGYLGLNKRDNQWQCAEFVQEVLAHVDIGIMCIKPTPVNILDYCLKTYDSNLLEIDS